MAVNSTKFHARPGEQARKSSSRSAARHPSDDEILGLVTSVARPSGSDAYSDEYAGNSAPPSQHADESVDQTTAAPGKVNSQQSEASAAESSPVPAQLVPVFEAHPELRQAWDVAHQFQQVFATPAAARDAQQQLSDLDGMFFSGRPADHAALAARIHELSPEAFHGLAQAMQAHAAKVAAGTQTAQIAAEASQAPLVSTNSQPASQVQPSSPSASTSASSNPVAASPDNAPVATPAPIGDPRRAVQAAFFHDTNAAAVEQILGAIHSQVDRLLPDSIGAGTRNRIVGEIYRELDATLRANRQLGKQLRDAFQAGPGDAAHQRAIVTLLTGRARQALPAVSKRVIGEWTQSIVAANRERLGRHEAASKRVDISGAGASDGVNRKPISPRDINYRKVSDADILNL